MDLNPVIPAPTNDDEHLERIHGKILELKNLPAGKPCWWAF
jgi:hypothetical protein